MGEILGLGMTHYPPLIGLDENMAGILRTRAQGPRPARALSRPRQLAGGDARASTATTAARPRRPAHRESLRQPLPPRPQDPRRLPARRGRHLGRRPARELHRGRDPAVLRAGLRPGGGAPSARATRRRQRLGRGPGHGRSASTAIARPASTSRGVCSSRAWTWPYAYKPLHHPGLAHAFLNTVMYLDYDRVGFPYPVVAFQVNCYGRRVIAQRGGRGSLANPLAEADLDPPSPSPKRCMEVGAATARVMRESPWRTALIASSSWSHAFLTDKNHQLYPDIEADRRALRGAPGRRLRDVAPAPAGRHRGVGPAGDAELVHAGRRHGGARPQAGRVRVRRDVVVQLQQVFRRVQAMTHA